MTTEEIRDRALVFGLAHLLLEGEITGEEVRTVVGSSILLFGRPQTEQAAEQSAYNESLLSLGHGPRGEE
jgi:hypothetical protein